MGTLRELGFFIFIALAQIRNTQTQDCSIAITSISSPSASSLLVQWSTYSEATNYILDLRVVNMTGVAPVVVSVSASTSQKEVFGLKPGTVYTVVLKVFRFFSVACSDTKTAKTVPDTSQIITSRAISSTAFTLEWDRVSSADQYFVLVNSTIANERYNLSFTSTSAVIQNLRPTTSYDCYVFTSNSAGLGARSRVRTVTTLVPPPVVVTVVPLSTQAVHVQWQAVDKVLLYKVTVTDSKGTLLLSTTVSSTFLDVQNLIPCRLQIITVASMNMFLDAGEPKQVNYTSNTLNAVSSVSTDYSCVSASAMVSWGAVFGAEFYRVTAVDQKGRTVSCTSTGTTCQLANLSCGKDYVVRVSAIANNCENASSATAFFQTAPCIPSNLITVSNCKSDVLMSSWDAVDGVSQFIVEGRGNRGNASYVSYYSCASNKSSCAIPGVACGESLTMMITAFNDDCYSEAVLGQETNTAPCVPQTLSPINDCSSDSITLTWSTANGALFYIASVTDSLGGQYSCSTSNLNCQITGLRCGTTYNATIISSNYKCNSSVSNNITVNTAPCPPNQVQATLDCEGNRALVSWLKSQFPGSYTATMVDQSGGQLNCSTVNSSCWIPSLKCGQAYNVSITYHNNICRSKTSSPISINSIPCGPENFHSSLECSSGAVQLTWDPTYGANGYSASVVAASSGRRMFCNSTFPNCSLSSLTCGESYVAQVRSYNGTCFSMLSQTVTFKGVPCAPTNVTVARTCTNRTTVMWQASLGAQTYRVIAVSNQGPCAPFNIHSTIQCITNIVTLSWDSSPTSMSYTGRAVGADGSIILCNSSSAQCQFMDLRCGLNYAIKLIASDGMCWSAESETYTQPTGPCAPVTVSNFLNCDTNMLSVSWTPSPLALSYSALLTPINGLVRGCTSDATNCVISGLQCGLSYSLTVLAANRVCTGPQSQSQTIQAAPCIPASVSANVVCASNTVHAAWAQAVGALSYTGILTSADGVTRSCSTSALSCEFSGLSCAKTYTVQVLANSNCNSSASTSVTVTTGPCDPSNMSAQVQCGSGAVKVSWQASAGASAYTAQAYLQNQTVPSDSCSSPNTTCSLTHLQCGTLYYVSVFASDGTCSSSPVGRTTVRTAPCPPVLQVVPSSCINDQALVLWTGSPDVLDVTVTATSVLGYSAGCTSANNSCNIQGLQCAQKYTLQGTSHGMLCNSTPSVPLNINTAPCPPAAIRANYTCGTSMAVVSWNDSLGRENFIARIQTQDQFDSCSTNLTRCTFSSLLCGRLYNVSLLAVAGQCNSSNIARTQMQTAPCAPQNVSVSLQCGNNTASVNWAPSLGAIGYDVTALGRDGDVKYCRTSNTYCQIPNLHCSQTYNFVVTPFSDVCTGWPSSTFTFTAGPCAPTGVQASLLCQNNVGVVSWIAAINAEKYIAIATSSDGFRHNCTTNGTSCQFLDLYCGKNYNITVVSVQGACWSDPSTPVLLRSAGCPPSNLVGVTQCGTNDITFTWDPSSRLGVTYFLFSQQENLANSTFNTTATFITLKHLQCGVLLTMRVAAQDNNCLSQYSAPVQIRTAPCAPSGLVATTSCGTSQATLSWLGGVGALFYTATLVSNDGGSISCTSNTNTCLVKLDCDSIYTVTVISSTGLCNSTTNSSTQLTSAPCKSENLSVSLECNTSIATVWWNSTGLDQSYSVSAVNFTGGAVMCSTNTTHCTYNQFQCGETYTVTVTGITQRCFSQPSTSVDFSTAPCTPTHVKATYDCDTSITVVMWDIARGAENYIVYAVSNQGYSTNFSTVDTTCNLRDLRCGQVYSITVVAERGGCRSQPSQPFTVSTGPCPQSSPYVSLDCSINSALVSWTHGYGILYYNVSADAIDVDSFVTCSTTGTSCNVTQLQCAQPYQISVTGQGSTCPSPAQGWVAITSGRTFFTVPNILCGLTYNVTVVAQNDKCNSSRSSVQSAISAPCPPQAISATINCTSNTILVNWSSSVVGASYMVQAVSSNSYYTCNSSSTFCSIHVPCGKTYNISVTPSQNGCNGVSSSSITIQSTPCVPTLTNVEMDCLYNSAWVMWNASSGAESYTAVATDSDGLRYLCNSSNSICTISGLQCGRNYSYGLTATNARCSSGVSNTMQVETVPCPPSNVNVSVNCESGTVTVQWLRSVGALAYTATLEPLEGNSSCCTALNGSTSCDVASLPCGQSYMVTVTAAGRTCNSSQSMAILVQTAPCQPMRPNATVSCTDNVANVRWINSMGGQLYTVTAVSVNGTATDSCSGFDGSCNLRGLACGLQYTASVVAQHSSCRSLPSPTTLIKTVPCAPQNVKLTLDCNARNLTISWNKTSGGQVYTATLRNSLGYATTCQSLTDQCTISGLSCGTAYHTSVIASDTSCSSQPSIIQDTDPISIFVSVPCAPSNIRAQMDIQASTAVLSWYFGAGSLRYKAIAVSSFEGTSVSCDTNQTNCNLINLLCGDKYNVTIQAVGNFCNKSASMGQYLQTGPCVPRLVSASYTPPVALLLWDMTRGADNYTAQAVSQHGSQASCSTRDTSCVLYSLNCSQTYNITLTAYNNIYQDGVKSNTLTLNTEPCPPTILTTRVVGDQGEVTWEPSIGAVRYTVMLEGRRGDTLYCQSTDTSCSVAGLLCGTVYVSRVTAIGTSINSSISVGALLTTVPCLPDPNSFAVTVQCPNNSASVSWAWSDGATSYELTATSNNGDQLKCVTGLNTCNITNLECGQTYNLSLTTINSAGAASLETGITFQSRPCVPKYVGANLQCGTRTAVLNWERKPGVLYYLGSATFSPKVAAVMCNSTTDSCSFSGLQCGVQYTLSVIAYTRQCWSDFSAPVNITTEPCPVQNLTVTGSCNTSSLQLNWSNVTGAQLYTISVTGNLGYTTAFQSAVPSLQVEVPCGQSYSFSVLGKNDQCYSLTSTTAKFSTAPCAPTAVQTFIQCEDNIASVSWVNSDGALNYTAVAKGQTLGQTSICTTNTTICNWSDLLCGELYTVRVTASNLYCSSAPSDNTTIRMAPCIPKILSANFDCGLRVASLTWEASRGTQSYLMTAENDISPMVGLTTNTTNAQISELHCGQQYYFKVSTVGQGCRSKPSNSSVLQTEPCPPTAVATSVDCLSNIATVTWGISSTADHYITNVVGPDSIVTTCMSSTTSCGIATLQCGQKYNVSVTASRLLCNSKPSVTTYLNTGPCAPLNLSVSISCGNNAATLFWSPGNGSMWYYASATNAQGDNRHCNTTGTSCIIAGLQCGAVYNFTVHGSDGVCNSSYSRVVQKAAAPCAQQSLNVSFSCGNNTATLSWSPNNGSLWYYASAITALGVNRQCNTTATSCTIAGLQCGTLYNFSVQGSDGVCNSSSSTTVQKATGPCAPQSLNVSFSCGNNTATLSWASSNGSLLYYASAVSAQGDSRQCNATGTSCTIAGLQCGTLYNFSVQGSDGVCNSSNSPVVPKFTSPCASQSLNVSFSCGNNTATLSWPPSNGSLWYYASAITALGDNRQCNTTGTSCAIAGLQCGTLYNFSVQGSDGVCSSPRNPVVRNVTAPCAPQSLNVSLSCENNTATLSWSPSNGSLWYYASAITALGVNRQCNTTASSCTIAGLQCGTLYNFSVQGSDGVCNSFSSPTVQKATAPCTPQSLNVSLSCENNTATVSWSSSNGSLGYYASAVNAQGDIRQCNSTGTSCSIAGLQCGIVYNFTVQATNGVCNSSRSLEVQKKSAPCSPQSPNVSFSSGNNTATLSWTPSNGSLWYYASAVNAPGDNRQCNATRTPCIIEGLQCGILYNFSVQGSDGVCNSSHNPVLQKITCPCAPQSLNVSFSCGNNTATLSWSPSNGSLLYYASAVSAQGDSRQCTATGTSCTIAGLQCGTLYNFSVQGSDGVCNSSNSPVVPKITSPCAPQSLNVSFSCGNNTATLSWASSNGSLLYYASAVSARGDSRQCNATGTSCTIAGLQCGTLYNFSVLGSDGVCNSSNSPVVPKITTPCASQSLNVSFSCGNNTATLSWSPSNGLPWYYASAITALGDNHQCNTTGTSCAIAGLQCGTLYSFSVQVSDGVCNSPSSPVVQRGAVPCPPDVIKNVNRQLENDTLVLLNWIPVNCTAVQYLVGLNGTFLNGDLVQLESYWTERTYFEFPLPCGISYSVVVTARSGAITGEPSVPIYGSTGVCQQNNTTNTGSVMGRRRRDLGEGETLAGLNDEGVLPVPKVKDVHLEGLTLYVKWAPVTGAIHYMLIVKEDPEYQPSEAVTVQNEVAEVPNLKPATRYCVTVAAKSSITQSAYSAPICLTTGIPIVNHENLHA
ncbi:hypothetical protein C0J50_6208 [Silurus asotus]|uniref:Fibronectin type-III domain-containing protein n=1 Tax=Silurus asotus TaxID=30991 RepID=A0AAD5FA27_SILAS|nr:hypothetical protein C0J50_6208 [Silurus asotus]